MNQRRKIHRFQANRFNSFPNQSLLLLSAGGIPESSIENVFFSPAGGEFIYSLECPHWLLNCNDLALLWLNEFFSFTVIYSQQNLCREHIIATCFYFPAPTGVPKFSLRRVRCKEWFVWDLLWNSTKVPTLSSSVPTLHTPTGYV